MSVVQPCTTTSISATAQSIAFDTVRRYLEFKGYKVNYVSNFTDVDDKMIKAANTGNYRSRTSKQIHSRLYGRY